MSVGPEQSLFSTPWTRQGQILKAPDPAGGPAAAWWASHAQAVTPLALEPRRWRLYFGGRGADNRSRMIWVDVDPQADMAVLERGYAPILDLGPPGRFDAAGQCPSSALWRGTGAQARVDLYYVGLHLRADVPYSVAVGLATSRDGAVFAPAVPGPVLSTGPDDPWFSSVAHVTDTAQGSHAWYMSGTGWTAGAAGPDPVYGLATATAPDGIHFTRTAPGIAASAGRGGLTRPWAVTLDGTPQLIFAERGTRGFRDGGAQGYRLMQVALGPDHAPLGTPLPLLWANPPAPEDWDATMQAYPAVMPLGPGHVLFYNGADFGRHGFGWATRHL